MSAESDVAIIGGGVAALSAAVWSARLGLSTTCVTDLLVGGQIINIEEVTNFPGLAEPVAGGELAITIEQQARDAGVEFVFGEALSIVPSETGYTVATTEQDVVARTVIVATGSRLRRLGVPGEDRLDGSGVSFCASCDGPLFTGRPVVVVGGGDSAADEALAVAEHASEVTVAMRDSELRAAATTVERVLTHDRITLRPGCEPLEVLGESTVSGLRVRDLESGAEEVLETAAVFVFVGLEPNTSLLADLADLDPNGHVATDPWMATRSPGVFAAGDIRRDSPRQLINVASDGATAAIAAQRYITA